MEFIRISAKNLGALAMPDFCPRCFWLTMKCKLPYQIFPGIFSSIDSYTKKITNGCYDQTGRIPQWFSGFEMLLKPVEVPAHTSFFIEDHENDIRLTGVPDEIFQRTDGSYFIADYKTAKFTGNQDHLMPIYRTQLNAYAYIGERRGFSPVNGLGLIYYEPQTEIGSVEKVMTANGFLMPFKAHLLPSALEPEKLIPPLLKEVRRICDLPKAPKGIEGCKDCERVEEMTALLGFIYHA